MALFGKKKRSRELPEGWIESGDQVLIPADEVPAELAEGERSFQVLDEWNGHSGMFVGVNGTAVQEAAEQAEDPRAAAEQAMNDPANWMGENSPDDVKVAVCRLDAASGKLDVGPAMTDLMLGAGLPIYHMNDKPCICINVQTIQEVVYREVEARGFDVTEDEHRALTYEAMDDPANWEGHPDDEDTDELDDDEPKYSFFPLDLTTGRIDRR